MTTPLTPATPLPQVTGAHAIMFLGQVDQLEIDGECTDKKPRIREVRDRQLGLHGRAVLVLLTQVLGLRAHAFQECEEALTFYASIFRNSRIYNVKRYGDAGPGKKG